MRGLLHIYTGDGKGKTTAALGLALRAAGRGRKVLFIQFLKGGDTGELHALARIPNITVLRLQTNHGFYHTLPEAEKCAVKREHDALLQTARQKLASGACDMLILDEVIAAYRLGALDRALADELILHKPQTTAELVLTGRDAPDAFVQAADYVSEIRKIKHPYDENIPAREGVEY